MRNTVQLELSKCSFTFKFSLLKFHTHFLSLPKMLYIQPVSSYLIWSSKYNFAKSRSYETLIICISLAFFYFCYIQISLKPLFSNTVIASFSLGARDHVS